MGLQEIPTEITEGIRISVNVTYRPDYSRPENNEYFFAYRITIENQSDYKVQLLNRHWHIFDSTGEFNEVKGDGVVGQQPMLRPGDIYEYESCCNLNSEMGRMHGTYTMQRIMDGAYFKVNVPEFQMIVPHRYN